MASGPIDESPEVPELQGPPEVLEAIDRFLADPSTGIKTGRPVRKCNVVLHHHTRPSLDEHCTFDKGHERPHSFEVNVESEDQDFPVYQGGQTFFPDKEDPIPDDGGDSSPHWLLIAGVGLVVIGLLVRWWLRRK